MVVQVHRADCTRPWLCACTHREIPESVLELRAQSTLRIISFHDWEDSEYYSVRTLYAELYDFVAPHGLSKVSHWFYRH